MPWSREHLETARSPETDPATLADLVPAMIVSPADVELAAALAGNPATPQESLAALLTLLGPLVVGDGPPNDAACHGAAAICCRAGVPYDAIEELLMDGDTPREFRKAVARDTQRRDVLELLAHDRSGKVRKWALRRLAATEDEEARS